MISASLHGLGRFGQHLLHAWLSNSGTVSIDQACDPTLSAQRFCALLHDHDRLDFSQALPAVDNNSLWLTRADGVRHKIDFHNGTAASAPWLGRSDVWLECSGLHTKGSDCAPFLTGRTQRVLISATSWDADQTLIMGFNHTSWRSDARVLSYGSCSVNAFVPLANYIHTHHGLLHAQVNIVHNSPMYRQLASPQRASCTLAGMAPRLLPFLSEDNLYISYVLIPYTGASLIDFQFRVRTPCSREVFTQALRKACSASLQNRYALVQDDPGAQGAIGSPMNALFYESGIRCAEDTIGLCGYMDNENSAVRYLELLQWLAQKIAL